MMSGAQGCLGVLDWDVCMGTVAEGCCCRWEGLHLKLATAARLAQH